MTKRKMAVPRNERVNKAKKTSPERFIFPYGKLLREAGTLRLENAVLCEELKRCRQILRRVYQCETWNRSLTASLVREVENELDRETIR